jgi:hypothetical protein
LLYSIFCIKAIPVERSNRTLTNTALIVNVIDTLYSNAIEPWKFELNPNKENDGLKSRRYLYSPMGYDGKITIVKITVKEYLDDGLQNKLYSIEAIDVELGR